MYGQISLRSLLSTTGTPDSMNASKALSLAGLNPMKEDLPIFIDKSVLESPIYTIVLDSKPFILASFSTISPLL